MSETTFTRLQRQVCEFLRSESGPTAVEYAVMLMLIILACIAGIQALGNSNTASWQNSASNLSAAMNPGN